jgi:putative ABC transport system permease protein
MLSRAEVLSVFRLSRRRWMSSVAIVLSVSIGLAVAGALFAVVDGLFMKRPPVADLDSLFLAGPTSRFRPGAVGTLSADGLQDLSRAPGVVDVGGFTTSSGLFEERYRSVERLTVTAVTGGFFRVLGVRPELGRALFAADVSEAEPRAVVIGHDLWGRRFGASPAVLDHVVTLGGRSVMVVGVMPQGFEIPRGTNVWAADRPHRSDAYRTEYLYAIIRMTKAGAAHLVGERGTPLMTQPLRQYCRAPGREVVMVLLIATVLTAFVGWAQVGVLQAALTYEQRRDRMIRVALGASPWQASRVSACHAAMLIAVSVAIGWTAVPAVSSLVVHLLPAEMTVGQPIRVDARALGFVLGMAVLATGAVAAGPAVVGMRGRWREHHGIGSTRGVAAGSWRWALAGVQLAVATSVVFVSVSAGLRFGAVRSAPVGIVAERLTEYRMPADNLPRTEAEVEAVKRRLLALPGAMAVAEGEIPLRTGKVMVGVAGHPPMLGEDAPPQTTIRVSFSKDYFRTLGLRVLEGTAEPPSAEAGGVAILSATLAKELAAGGAQLGRLVYIDGMPRRVIGVVSDIWADGPEELSPSRVVYVPNRLTSIVIRTADGTPTGSGTIADELRRALRIKGPLQVVDGAAVYAAATATSRSRALLLSLLAMSSLAIGSVGVWSSVAENVRRGARETAIRLAIGAEPAAIVRMYVSASTRTVLGGLSAGCLAGLAVQSLLASVVGGWPSAGLASTCVTSGLMLSVGLAAALVPARSAGRTDVLQLLRQD